MSKRIILTKILKKKIFIICFFFTALITYSQEKIEKSFFCLNTIFKNDKNEFEITNLDNQQICLETIDRQIHVSHYINNSRIRFTHNVNLENKIISLIDSLKSENKKEEICFFSFLNKNTLILFETYVYLPRRNLFITLNNKHISGLEDLIKFSFGSKTKFEEIIEENEKIKIIYNQNLKAFLKTDYQTSQTLFPKDTLKTINIFIDKVDQIVNLNIYEKEKIYGKIIKELKNDFPKEDYPYKHTINLFKKNITNALSEVLDNKRFFDCLKYFDLETQARNNINHKIYKEYELKKEELTKIKILTFDDYLRKILSE